MGMTAKLLILNEVYNVLSTGDPVDVVVVDCIVIDDEEDVEDDTFCDLSLRDVKKEFQATNSKPCLSSTKINETEDESPQDTSDGPTDNMALLNNSNLNECIEEWIEKGLIEVPVDNRYIASFFCDVVIREAMMYLIIKATGLNRLSAERAARRFLAPNFPDHDVWLHNPAYK
eukprot:gene8573-9487_t